MRITIEINPMKVPVTIWDAIGVGFWVGCKFGLSEGIGDGDTD